MTRKTKRKNEKLYVFHTIYGNKYYVTGNTWIDAYLKFSNRKDLHKEELQEGAVFCHKGDK